VIDTVKLYCQARPDDEQLRWFWRKREDTPARGVAKAEYYLNPEQGTGVPFRATYRPESRAGLDQLLVELSLPKLVFGENWRLLPDIETAIAACDETFAACQELPPLPSAGEMQLSRLDVCTNYEVHELLPYYIEALGRLDYPHRTTVRYGTQTVEYHSKSVKCKFYDKHAESQGKAPSGLLRHETTFHKPAKVRQDLGFDRPVTLADLNADLCRQVLETDLRRLGILDRPFATYPNASGLLIARYGNNRGPRLYGILCLYQNHGRDELAQLLDVDRNAVNRLLADIRRAGVSLALSEATDPLPPLTVHLQPAPAPRTCTQTPGVTHGSLALPPAGDAPCA
jgi:hypothetical protein